MAKGFNIRAWLGLDTKNFNKGLKKSEKETKGFAKSIKRLGGLIAGAFTISKITDFVRKVVEVSKEAGGVQDAFDKLGRGNLLDNLQNETDNTISKLDLMKAAVKFNNFKLPLDKLGGLLNFVRLRAQQTGDSFEYLRESLVEGLSKESKLRIDNLGISVERLNAELKKGIGFTQAVANIAQEELAKAGGVAETLGTKYQRMTSKWENFILSLSEGSGVISTVFGKLIDATSSVLNLLDKLEQGDSPLLLMAKDATDFDGKVKQLNISLVRNLDLQAKALDNINNQIAKVRRQLTGTGGDEARQKELKDELKLLREQAEVIKNKNFEEERTAKINAGLNSTKFKIAEISKTLLEIERGSNEATAIELTNLQLRKQFLEAKLKIYQRINSERKTEGEIDDKEISKDDDRLKRIKEYHRHKLELAKANGEETLELEKKFLQASFRADIEKLEKGSLDRLKIYNKYLEDRLKADKRYYKERTEAEKKDITTQVQAFWEKENERIGISTSNINAGMIAAEPIGGDSEVIDETTNSITDLANAYSVLGQSIAGAFSDDNAAQWWVNYASTVVTNVAKVITSYMAMVAANAAATASKAAADTASIPFGWIAIPGIIASVLAMFAPLTNMPKFAHGGIVGGTSFTGDNIVAGVNSGEMIINRAQQSNLFAMANGAGSTGGQAVEFEIRGDKLVGVLNNYSKKQSKIR